MQLYAGDISQCNECRCFSQQESHNRNLRNTALQQNHAKPLKNPKFWTEKEREREREREKGGGGKTLGPHCHAISSNMRSACKMKIAPLGLAGGRSYDRTNSLRTPTMKESQLLREKTTSSVFVSTCSNAVHARSVSLTCIHTQHQAM